MLTSIVARHWQKIKALCGSLLVKKQLCVSELIEDMVDSRNKFITDSV
jgi:hypothetical protein